MKLMVGQTQGRFFAYDVSTLEQLKAAYFKCAERCKPWEPEDEDADTTEVDSIKNQLQNAQTEGEFIYLAEKYGDQMQFYLNCRGVCEFVKLE